MNSLSVTNKFYRRIFPRVVQAEQELAAGKNAENFSKYFNELLETHPFILRRIVSAKEKLSPEQKQNAAEAALAYCYLGAKSSFKKFLKMMKHNKKIKFSLPEVPFERFKGIQTAYETQNKEYQRYMKKILTADMEGRYQNFFNSSENKYYEENKKFLEFLKSQGKALDNWFKSDTKKMFIYNSQPYEISTMERKPMENIFLGDYVQACTSLSRGNFHRILNFLMNASYKYGIIKNSDNVIVAYERVKGDNINGVFTLTKEAQEWTPKMFPKIMNNNSEKFISNADEYMIQTVPQAKLNNAVHSWITDK